MTTYTYVLMEVSKQTFQEIERKMKAAGYDDQIHQTTAGGDLVIDMRGIGLAISKEETSHLIVNDIPKRD